MKASPPTLIFKNVFKFKIIPLTVTQYLIIKEEFFIIFDSYIFIIFVALILYSK